MGKLVLFSHSDFTSIHTKEREKKYPGEEKHTFCLKDSPAACFREVMGQKKTGTETLKMWHTLTQAFFRRMPKTEHAVKSSFGKRAEQRDFLCRWATYDFFFSAVGVRIRKVVYYSTISSKARKTLFIRNFKSLCHRYQVYILYAFAKSN